MVDPSQLEALRSEEQSLLDQIDQRMQVGDATAIGFLQAKLQGVREIKARLERGEDISREEAQKFIERKEALASFARFKPKPEERERRVTVGDLPQRRIDVTKRQVRGEVPPTTVEFARAVERARGIEPGEEGVLIARGEEVGLPTERVAVVGEAGVPTAVAEPGTVTFARQVEAAQEGVVTGPRIIEVPTEETVEGVPVSKLAVIGEEVLRAREPTPEETEMFLEGFATVEPAPERTAWQKIKSQSEVAQRRIFGGETIMERAGAIEKRTFESYVKPTLGRYTTPEAEQAVLQFELFKLKQLPSITALTQRQLGISVERREAAIKTGFAFGIMRDIVERPLKQLA
jgi:hypothetical protein